MTRPRVSIAGMMTVVLVCALGVAALRAASPLWAGVALTTTLALLGLAILGALFRSGDRRAFWAGFAVFGWGYLTLAFGPWFVTEIEPKLATSSAILALHEKLHPGASQTSAILGAAPTTSYITVANATNTLLSQGVQRIQFASSNPQPGGTGTPLTLWMTATSTTAPNLEEFRRIGHSLFALFAALVGGIAARRFAQQRPVSPTSEIAP